MYRPRDVIKIHLALISHVSCNGIGLYCHSEKTDILTAVVLRPAPLLALT